MAVRPIDANAMLNELRPVNFEAEHSAVLLSDVSKMMREWVERQPTLTPPNEPLSIEQLREMDGEPVWIVDIGPHKWYGPGWAIVDRDNCLVRTAKNWNPVFFERYGERWLAYRRPPEGEAGDVNHG